MSSIVVTRTSPDGLSQSEWRFASTIERSTVTIRLNWYGTAVRPTKRHSFKVPAADRWDWMDERGYHSGLTRTQAQDSVTDDVISEATAQIKVHYERRADNTWEDK